ncbi:MAG: hypothetical protein ACYTHJ_05885 [Planctomycetota bacterium]|jgi:hypothetical protein
MSNKLPLAARTAIVALTIGCFCIGHAKGERKPAGRQSATEMFEEYQ